MRRKFLTLSIALLSLGGLMAQTNTQPPAQTIGPNPQLAKPHRNLTQYQQQSRKYRPDSARQSGTSGWVEIDCHRYVNVREQQ